MGFIFIGCVQDVGFPFFFFFKKILILLRQPFPLSFLVCMLQLPSISTTSRIGTIHHNAVVNIVHYSHPLLFLTAHRRILHPEHQLYVFFPCYGPHLRTPTGKTLLSTYSAAGTHKPTSTGIGGFDNA